MERGNMKVLFLSVTVGAGHNAVAKNIKSVFDSNENETLMIDMFAENKAISNMIGGYGFKAMYVFPKIANYIYYKSKKTDYCLYDNLIKKIKKPILDKINQFKPDVIISSHIAGYLFTQKYRCLINTNFKNFYIVTDYDIPPSVRMAEDNDYIIVPNNSFVKELENKGIEKNKIIPLGIPINEKFYTDQDKLEILKYNNLEGFDLNKKTILLMGGGKGLGKIYKTIKFLGEYENIQMLVVCGKNAKLKSRVDNIKTKAKIFNFGYCTNVDELMVLSNYLFGKTGGLTTTEAICKNLKIISFKNIPCPEYCNLNYLIENNLAFGIKSNKDIISLLDKNDNAVNDIIKKHSSKSIYDFVKMIQEPSKQ